MRQKICSWLSICIILLAGLLGTATQRARADLFGGDVVVLTQILAQAIQQVRALQQVIGRARETVSLLEEMNRGVKEVLRLAETAHIPLPRQAYEQARQIDAATAEARRVYGAINGKAPITTQVHFRSGVEGLFLSQDAFDYSIFLDKQGERVKAAAIISSQATATRLSAETLGVLLHAVSHGNRLQAKELEIQSDRRIEGAAKDGARFDEFVATHEAIQRDMKSSGFSSLNAFSE